MDIAVTYSNENQAMDIELDNDDLKFEEGLSTSVLLSLYLDSRAKDDSGIDNPDLMRGWWGDLLAESPLNVGIGSNIWLLSRSSLTQTTYNLVELYIEECLQWMITDGVAKKILVAVEQTGSIETPIVSVVVSIFKRDGNVETSKFNDLWENQFKG